MIGMLGMSSESSGSRRAPSSDGDLAAHADAQRIECLVVFDQAVINVDDVGGDVTVPRVTVERRDLRSLPRLRQRELSRLRVRTWNDPGGDDLRLRDIDRVLLAPRVDAPRPQVLEDVVSRRGLCGRTRHVRYGREVAGHLPHARRVGDGDETLLE